jgi:DNA-binding NarL/FixJ family response regulator
MRRSGEWRHPTARAAAQHHEPIPAAPVLDPDEVRAAGGVRVLVVDDDPQMGGQLRELLTDFDHTVVGLVSNSIQALILMKALRPDVVLTDLRMPGMSGVQLAARVRQMPHPPAVVIISAYDDASLQRESREAGAHGYVVKGSPGERLHRAVLAAAASRDVADLSTPP